MGKKRKSLSVGKHSGQTDTERRKLRHSQRLLLKDVTGADGDLLEDATKDEFDRIRDANNELFDKVRFAREAVLDGENLDAIASRAARQADRLVAVARYDAQKFIRKLRSKCCDAQTSEFQWGSFGRVTGTCFNSVVTMNFLNGPLEHEVAAKKKVTRQRKQITKEECEEEKPEELARVEKKKDRASLAEKHYKQVQKAFHKRSAELAHRSVGNKKQRVDVELPNLLLNPKSFTESVENFFHFSFLVKKGHAGLDLDKQGNPVTFMTEVNNDIPARQSIVTLDMKSWKRMTEAYNIDKSFVPSRT